jgi:hypothetical protein
MSVDAATAFLQSQSGNEPATEARPAETTNEQVVDTGQTGPCRNAF